MSNYLDKCHNLSEIIFRMVFDPIDHRIFNKEPIEFRNNIAKTFPQTERIENKEIKFNYTKEGNQEINSIPHIVWKFTNQNQKQMVLEQNAITINYNGMFYSSFNDIRADIGSVLSGFNYGVENVNGVSLRYIFQIQNSNYKLNELITDKFHANFSDDKLIRSMNKIEYKVDDYHFFFNYGEFNQNYPNNLVNRFMLDYDCQLNKITPLNNIKITLEDLHDVNIEYFNKTTSDIYKQIINQEYNKKNSNY